jgi:spermidine synthase
MLNRYRYISVNIILIVIGFISVVAQTILIRELISTFYGNELCLGVIFASWLFWMAIGSGTATKVKALWKPEIFVIIQIVITFLFPLTIFLIRNIKPILHIAPHELIGYPAMIVSIFLLLAPLGIAIGSLFTFGCKFYTDILKELSTAPGKAYLYDGIGDILGGVTSGYIFITFFNSFQTAFYTGIINLSAGLVLLLIYTRKIIYIIIVSVCLIVSVYGGYISDKLIAYVDKLSWRGLSLVSSVSSKYGNIAVIKEDELYNFYQNGILTFTNPQRLINEELIHLPLLQTPTPKQILILGNAVSGGLYEALKYTDAKIYYVELDKMLITTAEKYITKKDLHSLRNSRVKLIYGDGRLFIKKWDKELFDCVIVNTGSPATAERNRFYTIEFFKEVKNILKHDGVISISIRSNENYLGDNMRQFNGCIYHTLKQVFPYVILIPGSKLTMIASCSPKYLTEDPNVLADRLKKRNIPTCFVNEYYLPYRLYQERIEYIRNILEDIKPKINHDLYPVCYYFDMVLWGEEFSQGTERLLNILSRINILYLLLGMVMVFIILWLISICKKQVIIGVPAGVFFAGCGSMVIEIVLIIGFQILFGYIYHMIGIIIAGFMLGLTAGTWYMNNKVAYINRARLLIIYSVLEIAIGIYLFLLPGIFLLLRAVSYELLIHIFIQILFPILTAIAGMIIGLIFPLANQIYMLYSSSKPSRAGGILYAMDLTGACIGSLIASIITIPVFGIPNTCILFGLSNVISAILIFQIRRRT